MKKHLDIGIGIVGIFSPEGDMLATTDEADIVTISALKQAGLEIKPLILCPCCKGKGLTEDGVKTITKASIKNMEVSK